ncbi:MAG: winged helix-turn-helix domain-containing protein [Acidobacteriota bacterium]
MADKPLARVIQSGDLRMDCVRRRFSRSGEFIDLTPREFDLLKALMRRSGDVLSREHLLTYVWGKATSVNPNNVETLIRSLRAKMDHKWPSRVIQTVRLQGYRLKSQ